MKKSITNLCKASAFTPSLLILSCSSDDFIEQSLEANRSTHITHTITPEQAMNIAQQVERIFKPAKNASRSQSMSILPIIKRQSRSSCQDTLMYIVGYGEDEGFSVISASQSTPPVLGYVDSGNYYDLDTVENPGFTQFIDAAKSYVEEANGETLATGSSPVEITPAFREWTIYYNDSIPARLCVKWGQSYPEGVYCINGYSGCTQTALAQVLSHFEFPKSINLTYLDNRKLELNWAEIKKHKNSITSLSEDFIDFHLNNCEASQETHQTISYLLRELGKRNNAIYEQKGTGATLNASCATAKDIIPSEELCVSGVYDYNATLPMITYLADGGLIIMRGSTANNEGHEWVADGGIRIGRIEYRTDYVPDLNGNYYTTVRKYLDLLIHFNWGWNGNCNGYFEPEVFKTNSASTYDNPGANSTNCDFSKTLKYYYISPYQKLQL